MNACVLFISERIKLHLSEKKLYVLLWLSEFCITHSDNEDQLTHLGRDKMGAILQTVFSN